MQGVMNIYRNFFLNIRGPLVLCFMLIQPVRANVRTCMVDHFNYVRSVLENRLCRIPMNSMPDGSCRYQWFLNMKKKEFKTIPDSLIMALKALTNDRYYDFPSNAGSRYINDTFCIQFNVSMFCDTTMSIDRRIEVFEVLLDRTSDGVLLPYRAEIIAALNWCRLNLDQKAMMAALLNCNKTELKSLFDEKNTLPLNVQARFGNKEAIGALIVKFDSTQIYDEKIRTMKDLLFSGDVIAIRHVIEQFGQKAYQDKNGCIAKTIQCEILESLSKYHVRDPILNEEFNAIHVRSRANGNQDAVKDYFKKVYAWMYEKYKVKPLNPPPYLFFSNPCPR